MKLVLDNEGLAEALSLALNTVRMYASTNPEKLPPRLNLPYSKPMYAVEDVQEWIRQHSPVRQGVTPAPQESGCSTSVVTLSPGALSRLRDLGLLSDGLTSSSPRAARRGSADP